MTDRELMRLAISEAVKSRPEDSQPRPRVGVVFARDGNVLVKAYRNEDGKGSHAEYLALEKLKVMGQSAAGTTVYTTLEPCFHRKNKGKIACAKRLVEAEVARVVYGNIDPHKTVQSKGLLLLRTHQIPVDSFPSDLAAQIEVLNLPFINAFTRGEATEEFVIANQGRSLDEWYQTVNRIYWRQNAGRSPAEAFGHLVELIGAISVLETKKNATNIDPKRYIVKAFAWWLTLCGKLQVRSVEEMIWAKFPRACPYCRTAPHRDDCRSSDDTPYWQELKSLGSQSTKPSSLGGWQRMFRDIYPKTASSPLGSIFAHLTEELGELAAAVRVFEFAPGMFLDEAPDVLAWILQLQNALDTSASVSPGDALERAFCFAYPIGWFDPANEIWRPKLVYVCR
jgi:pyrimidine deaminase RibD-like protein/NTP pyrophosphatase (non-canonical NTP hydrolase)